jgi:hypothetical protein
VKLCLEDSKRLLAKPVKEKLPITVDMLKKIIDRIGKKDSTLSDLRTYTLCAKSGICLAAGPKIS